MTYFPIDTSSSCSDQFAFAYRRNILSSLQKLLVTQALAASEWLIVVVGVSSAEIILIESSKKKIFVV